MTTKAKRSDSEILEEFSEMHRKRKVLAWIIIFIFLACLLGSLLFLFLQQSLWHPIPYTPGEVQTEKVTPTGAVIVITKTWSNRSMPLDYWASVGQAVLDWDDHYVCLSSLDFLSKIASTPGGSIQFVDVNGDGKISVGDKFYLGSETDGGEPLWPNTSYTFYFDDDSSHPWEVTFRTGTEVQIEDVTPTGAVLIVTRTWNNRNISLENSSIDVNLRWYNGSVFLRSPDFLSEIASTPGGSIQFVDVNGDGKISVGDKFYLGSETDGGEPLWPDTIYYFWFYDNTAHPLGVTFRTKA